MESVAPPVSGRHICVTAWPKLDPRPELIGNHRSGVNPILEAPFSSGQQQGELRLDIAPQDLAWLFEFMTTGAVIVRLCAPEVELASSFLFALDVLLDGAATKKECHNDHFDNGLGRSGRCRACAFR